MLAFFRKYQKLFFIFVTIIIVTSFVFFGTYQAFAPTSQAKEETAFVLSSGKKITKSYLSDMTRFLASEPLSFRGAHNFLNDNIVSREFLDTNIALHLVALNQDKICKELEEKLPKEKGYRLYKHPYMKELSAENVWGMFAPTLATSLQAHLQGKAIGSEAFSKKMSLFLAEKVFPGDLLSYIIRLQEKEVQNLPPDHRLINDSLALFGYKDLTDWFGQTFVESTAKAVIQGASLARNLGYKISKDEISADVVYKREKAFQYLKKQYPHITNSYSLYQECLGMLQLDETRLFAILEDVLLFQKLMHDATDVNLVDSFALKRFYEKAHECAEVEFVKLPEELRFKTEEKLKLFEAYLQAVSSHRENPLALPAELDPVDEIAKRACELVYSVFQVEYAHLSKKELEAKVTVKETWDWEEKNQTRIKERFPFVNSMALLEGEKRAEIDSFARGEIVETHPEWIEEVLATKDRKDKKLSLPKDKLPGISDYSALIKLLEKEELLSCYTQDGENYYFLKVKERLPKQVFTFKEACERNLLAANTITDEHLESLFKALTICAKEHDSKVLSTKEALIPYRFAPYLQEVKENKEKELPLWRLERSKDTIFRYSRSIVSFAQAIASNSSLLFSEQEGIFFFHLVDKRVETSLPLDKMLQEEKLLSCELKEALLQKILQ